MLLHSITGYTYGGKKKKDADKAACGGTREARKIHRGNNDIVRKIISIA